MKLSISSIKLFKACPKAYRFKYIERLEPVKRAEALEVGTNYHSKIEQVYEQGYCPVDDFSRESAMALAYEKYIYPNFKMKSVEDWFEYKLNDKVTLVGRTDGIAEDGYLVEHKTTGTEITDEYEYELQWDEQILAYMLQSGDRKMWYTVIRKPTIRQRKDENEEDFFDRMCKWYDDDTEHKIKLLEIVRTDEEVENFKEELVEIAKDIERAEKNPEERMYRNTMHCHCWGRRCEYSSICLNYQKDQEYVEFTRR